MPELTTADVESFTRGRLLASDPETGRFLAAALAAARREVGWHVSPVKLGDVVTMAGAGGIDLYPPTRNIVNLISVTDDGADVLADVAVVAPWKLARKTGFWSRELAAISITMDHGYTESEAADWRHAILAMVDQMSLIPASATAGRSDADLTRKRVDDVEYQWSDGNSIALAQRVIYSVDSILSGYRLLRGFA